MCMQTSFSKSVIHVHVLSRAFLATYIFLPVIDELLQVKQLFVRSSHRRQGLGGLLLDGMKKANHRNRRWLRVECQASCHVE